MGLQASEIVNAKIGELLLKKGSAFELTEEEQKDAYRLYSINMTASEIADIIYQSRIRPTLEPEEKINRFLQN